MSRDKPDITAREVSVIGEQAGIASCAASHDLHLPAGLEPLATKQGCVDCVGLGRKIQTGIKETGIRPVNLVVAAGLFLLLCHGLNHGIGCGFG